MNVKASEVVTTEEHLDLRRRLDEFYAQPREYSAFQQIANNSRAHEQMDVLIAEVLARKGHAHVLELGAGRTDYGHHLRRKYGDRVTFHTQDVTPANLEHLKEISSKVFIGDVTTIIGTYDLICSFYVFEHVSNPREFLAAIHERLAERGWHVIVCPRYDAPGYLCPSLRHQPRLMRIKSMLALAGRRLRDSWQFQERFLINLDPSVFHTRWFRDADAVHLVSRKDVRLWHARNGYVERQLRLRSKGWREVILHRMLTLLYAGQKSH